MKKITKLTAAVTAMALASVSAVSIATMNFTASAVSADPQDEPPFTAYLCLQAGADSQWEPGDMDGENAEITGDGTYSASIVMNNGSGSIELLFLETNINSYVYAPEGAEEVKGQLPTGCTADLTIDSIKVEKTSGDIMELGYNGPSDGALRCSDNGSTIRMNILNTWTSPSVADIDGALETGLDSGDKIVVTFTITGINEPYNNGGDETTIAPATTTAKPTTKATTTTTTKAATTTTAAATSKLARGDFDGDGKITIQDAYNTLLAYSKRSAGKDSGLTKDQETALDVDGNGNIDIQDAYKILLYYSNQSAGNTVDWDKL